MARHSEKNGRRLALYSYCFVACEFYKQFSITIETASYADYLDRIIYGGELRIISIDCI